MGNSYDEIKSMLNKVRKIQAPTYLREQVESVPQGSTEKSDFIVLDDGVEVMVHTTDKEDLKFTDEEKNSLNTLIQSFKTTVTNLVTLNTIHIYENSARMEGEIVEYDLFFTFITGDQKGLYVKGAELLKVTPEFLDLLNKLNKFSETFNTTLNNLISNRLNS